MVKRLTVIDDLRGVGILMMIMIHTNAYFMAVPVAFALVEASQFAVVAFIFCSAYLFFLKQGDISLKGFFVHLLKRIRRLIIPYYLFVAGNTLFLYLSSPKKLDRAYFINNLTLWGGIDFNWLVGLFVELAILMPVILLLYRRFRPGYILYMAAAFASSVYFLYHTPLPWYRLIMWLPWSLILGYTLHMDRIWKDKRLFIGVTLALALLVFLSRQLVLIPNHHALRMYDNKYPPNIYHLAFSLFGMNIVYFLAQKGVFRPVARFVHFFSYNSYPIFFIHILVIYVLTVFLKIHFTWVTFFLATVAVSSAVQMAINYLTSFLRYRGGRRSGYSPARAD